MERIDRRIPKILFKYNPAGKGGNRKTTEEMERVILNKLGSNNVQCACRYIYLKF